jgi:NAD(P)-dependent dehydrogenase (short-subunit alcohol dehydrogenase family)
MNDVLFSVTGEIVVISGVNGQLGRQYARAFLDRGAAVMGLDVAAGEPSDALSRDFGSKYCFALCDVTVARDLENALNLTRARWGAPTVLINNAGIDVPPDAVGECGRFETYSDDSWNRVMNVNVTGVYQACKVFGGAMASAGRGSIINISSIYGVVSPDQSLYEYRRQRGETFYKPAAYAVSKSAILNLTRYLAVYWAKSGVRVNTLVLAGVANNQDSEFLSAYSARIPVGRMASDLDYNGAVIFLASRASTYMTGAELRVDGGWTAI